MLVDYKTRVQLLLFPVVRQLWLCGILNAFRCFASAIALKSFLSEKGLIFKGLFHWSEMCFALCFSKRFVQRFTACVKAMLLFLTCVC